MYWLQVEAASCAPVMSCCYHCEILNNVMSRGVWSMISVDHKLELQEMSMTAKAIPESVTHTSDSCWWPRGAVFPFSQDLSVV